MSDYNGWKNYETWNVALWIGNDEGLYNMARECRTYGGFIHLLKECFFEYREATGGASKIALETPDGVAWSDSGLDTDALNDMIAELREG